MEDKSDDSCNSTSGLPWPKVPHRVAVKNYEDNANLDLLETILRQC